MSSLSGKKILFIGIGFYDYEDAIKSALVEKGAQVSYINSSHTTLSSRIANKLKQKRRAGIIRSRYILGQIEKFKGNDVVFVIKGEHLYHTEINALKTNNPEAKFILYMWDSVRRHDNAELLLNSFDDVWSFDRLDCENNSRLKFRPLFYRTIPARRISEYELSFVGWEHSDRLALLRILKKQLLAEGKPYYFKLYMGRFRYLWKRYITHELKYSDEDMIVVSPVKYDEIQRVTASSKIVLDIAHPAQSGLTMRTIETLAAGCHLLTTNKDIKNYSDISKVGFTIFDRTKPNVPYIDLETHRNVLSTDYSLIAFIDQIFA